MSDDDDVWMTVISEEERKAWLDENRLLENRIHSIYVKAELLIKKEFEEHRVVLQSLNKEITSRIGK